MQVQKKYPHRVQKTHRHVRTPPTFFVPPGPKKKPAMSKKHVQVQKRVPGAQVQKTCIPSYILFYDATQSLTHRSKMLGSILNTLSGHCTKSCNCPAVMERSGPRSQRLGGKWQSRRNCRWRFDKGLPKRPCLVQNRGESFCDLSGHWMFALLN